MQHISEFAENAKKGRQTREFIANVRCMVPNSDEKKQALESIGFDSLQHFIYDSEGLGIDGETFVNLAFAYFCYRKKAWETINHLVTVEGWSELLKYVPAEYQVECGPKLKNPNNKKDDDSKTNNNVIGSSVQGNSKSYTLRRLARDAEQSPEVAEKYKAVKRGELSANQAAIALGWRPKTITVRKDVESAAQSLRRLFDSDEIEALKRAL
jgi:hypothetical protein